MYKNTLHLYKKGIYWKRKQANVYKGEKEKMEKEHQKTTLMSWKKEQLVEHIQCLEHNNNALEERLEIQSKNFWLIVNDIRHKVCEEIRENAQYKNWSKAVPFVYVITPEQLSEIEKGDIL